MENEIKNFQNLHNLTGTTLNIQLDTFTRLVSDRNHPSASKPYSSNRTNQVTKKSSYHVPKIMVSNVMSLVPKLTEVQEFILRNQIDIAFITETWLKQTIVDDAIAQPIIMVEFASTSRKI